MNIKFFLFSVYAFLCTNVSYSTLLRSDMSYQEVFDRNWFNAFKNDRIITLTPTKSWLGFDQYMLRIDIARLHEEFVAVSKGSDAVKKLLKIGEDLFVNDQLIECLDSDTDGPLWGAFFGYFNAISHELTNFMPAKTVKTYKARWLNRLYNIF